LKQDKTSISILQLEPVLGQILKNRKPRGTHRSVTLSEQKHPTAPPLLCQAHGFAAATALAAAHAAFSIRLARL
jgi:hypothetical protein